MTNIYRYIVLRVVTGALTLLMVTLIVFGLLHFVPGDPVSAIIGEGGYSEEEAEELRQELGLDEPLPVRYVTWLGDVATGDLGTSIRSGRDVTDVIKAGVPITLELAAFALFLAAVIGIPLGAWSAVRRDKVEDYVLRFVSIAGLSVPSFWLATMVIILPAIWWGWVPPLRYVAFMDDPVANIQLFLLPSAILALWPLADVVRMTRSSMLDVLMEDYMRTARAKGLAPITLNFRHGVRNAILPVVTVIGSQFVFLLGGAIVIETVFSLPGLGTAMLLAIQNRDFPVITGINLIVAVAVVTLNLLVDLSYGVLDPRISL